MNPSSGEWALILADIDIINFRNMGHLEIWPWNPQAVKATSYDLHLAPLLKRQVPVRQENAAGQVCVDTFIWIEEKFAQDCRGEFSYELLPGEFLLFSTLETVQLGAMIAGQVAGKSTHARNGLVTENAGWVDAGYSGQLTLEFSNISQYPIRLVAGMPICQIVFMETRSAAQHPYGSEGSGSKYMHQTGPTSAR
jgi:dCTP deaminase